MMTRKSPDAPHRNRFTAVDTLEAGIFAKLPVLDDLTPDTADQAAPAPGAMVRRRSYLRARTEKRMIALACSLRDDRASAQPTSQADETLCGIRAIMAPEPPAAPAPHTAALDPADEPGQTEAVAPGLLSRRPLVPLGRLLRSQMVLGTCLGGWATLALMMLVIDHTLADALFLASLALLFCGICLYSENRAWREANAGRITGRLSDIRPSGGF